MERAYSFLPTYLGGTFSPLLDISERNFFPQVGGGGVHVHPHCVRARVFAFLIACEWHTKNAFGYT